jgi:hypothetical protein
VVRQPALPLWRRVVFVDWHGVLSRSPFWASIVTDPRHPLNRPLRARLGRLYGDQALMAAWMTARRATADVVGAMGVEGGARYGTDYLCRQLERDCRVMRVNVELLRVLRTVQARAFVVVATDNVDSFAETFRRLAARREPRVVPEPEPADTLAAWAGACDDLVCSSDVGVLKSGDARAFFGPYLAACGLEFGDALLIDDGSENCTAFRAAGGAALRWTMHTDPLSDVTDTLRAWLGRPDPPDPPGRLGDQSAGQQEGEPAGLFLSAAAPAAGPTSSKV